MSSSTTSEAQRRRSRRGPPARVARPRPDDDDVRVVTRACYAQQRSGIPAHRRRAARRISLPPTDASVPASASVTAHAASCRIAVSRPRPPPRFAAMPPLITREEALRARRARRTTPRSRRWSSARGRRAQERFGDSTDMCSLVNAKSRRLRRGLRLLRAVALRRGRDADARDDGARADPRARARGRGGGRAPLLHGHPGPGAVQARLREGARGRAARRRAHEPQALRVDRPHVSATRAQALQGGRHPARAPQRRDGASPTTPRSRRRSATRAALRTIEAVKEAGLETCVGGILNLGEIARAARRDGLRAGRDRPDVACRSTCSTRARARSSATATTWTRGRR